MVSSLAENRRARMERHAAYVALARAILTDEQPDCAELTDVETFVTSGNLAA